MISVHRPVVGKHMSVEPAVRKTHEARGVGRRRDERRGGKGDEKIEQRRQKDRKKGKHSLWFGLNFVT